VDVGSAVLDGVGAGVTALDLVVAAASGDELVATAEVVAGAAAPGVAVLQPPSTAAETIARMAVGQRETVTFMVIPPRIGAQHRRIRTPSGSPADGEPARVESLEAYFFGRARYHQPA
jgi:hypothetical protein